MKYYKIIENEIITMIGSSFFIYETQIEITKEEYDSLILIIQNKPIDTLEFIYFLTKNGIYESRERTHDEIIDWYIQEIKSKIITIEEVPEKYKIEVEAKLPKLKN